MPAGGRVGVVGGGMLGLTLALRLAEQGHEVVVLEASTAPGGLASPQAIGGFTWDRFYHVILLSDLHLRGLLDELGLAGQLQWGDTRTGFYVDGRMYSLSTSYDFLTFPPLGLIDKARLAVTILRAARLKDGRALEAVPVAEWLRRWSGRRTFERIWLPLLQAKLGENYHQTSAAFIWAVIARMYAARHSGLKRERFGFVEGGYDTVLRRLREVLAERGVSLLTGVPVAEIRDTGDGVAVRSTAGAEWLFDRVVATVPCSRLAALCPQLTTEERSRLGRVVYQGVACASLLIRRPLAGYYVTNLTDDWVPFTAVIEMTALVDPGQFDGLTLVYLPRYLAQDDPWWARSDQDIREEFLGALERIYPGFDRADVVAFQVARVRDVLAVSTLNYTADALPSSRTSLPNVLVVNSAQIANGTLNNNEIVGLANAKARELAPYLACAPAGSGAPR